MSFLYIRLKEVPLTQFGGKLYPIKLLFFHSSLIQKLKPKKNVQLKK
jgi:hypothetical protein